MANVLLGVTGSVAAIRTPLLYQSLKQAGHAVKVVATQPALYFFDARALPPGAVHTDEDEWPRRKQGDIYSRNDPVLHIELRRWADMFLIAPLDANTLAKLACGLCDNCLTCVWRAWDLNRPIILAPAMNTLMWEHRLTTRHFRTLMDVIDIPSASLDANLFQLLTWINAHAARLRVVGPQEKLLACGDVGLGAMSEVPEIVAVVESMLTPVVSVIPPTEGMA
jgi:phosphopantothenoylcysteine decarboxylase